MASPFPGLDSHVYSLVLLRLALCAPIPIHARLVSLLATLPECSPPCCPCRPCRPPISRANNAVPSHTVKCRTFHPPKKSPCHLQGHLSSNNYPSCKHIIISTQINRLSRSIPTLPQLLPRSRSCYSCTPCPGLNPVKECVSN